MSEVTIPLAEVIQELRRQLLRATAAGTGQELRFEVQDLELELQVLVTRGAGVKAGGSGGVKFWVLEGKGSGEVSGSYESSRIQKVKLTLKPKPTSGGTFEVVADGDLPELDG